MAVAIRERRVLSAPTARTSTSGPTPTPLLDGAGKLIGAVRLLLDVAGRERTRGLRARAARCRRLVNLLPDRRSVKMLHARAAEYEQEAFWIEQSAR